jgi:DNA-binding Lrp family transcriptional regulator
MAKILELSERKTKELIKKLKANGIIKEISVDGIKYFAFNPVYGLKNKRINLHVFIFFQNELKEVLPKWAYYKFVEQSKEINPNVRIVK